MFIVLGCMETELVQTHMINLFFLKVSAGWDLTDDKYIKKMVLPILVG